MPSLYDLKRSVGRRFKQVLTKTIPLSLYGYANHKLDTGSQDFVSMVDASMPRAEP